MNIENIPFTCPTLTMTIHSKNTVFFHNNAVQIDPKVNLNVYLNSGHSNKSVLLMYTGGAFLKILAGKFGQANIPVSDIYTANSEKASPKKVLEKVTVCKNDIAPVKLLSPTNDKQCTFAMSTHDCDPRRVASDNKTNNAKNFSNYHPIIAK